MFFGRKARLAFQINRGGEKTGQPETISSDIGLTATNEATNSTAVYKSPRHHGPYRLGQKVRHRLPHVPKGTTPWSKVYTITEVLGFFTYRLSSGSVWNARKLRHVYDQQTEMTCPLGSDPPAVLPVPQPAIQPRRSQRRNFGVPPRRYTPSP